MSGRCAPKIVKVVGSNPGFSVRLAHSDGYEIDFSFHSTLQEAQANLNKYKKKLSSEEGYAVALAVRALGDIMNLTHKIYHAGDTQGQAEYATKAHMRQWALEANRLASDARRAMEDVDERLLNVVPLVIEDDDFDPADEELAFRKHEMGGWTKELVEEFDETWPPQDGWQQKFVDQGFMVRIIKKAV